MAKKQTPRSNPSVKPTGPNLFATASVVEPPARAKAGKNKTEVQIARTRRIALLHSALESLTAEYETLCGEVKNGPITDQFLSEGLKRQSKPDNFRAIDGNAEASVEMRKRSSRSPLSPEQIALCEQAKVPTEKNVIVARRYVINEVYGGNDALLAEVANAINEKIPDFNKKFPHFFQLQEEQSTVIVADAALDEIFKQGENFARMFLPVVTTLAIKPVIQGETVQELSALVSEVLGEAEERKKAEAAEAAKG